MRFSVVSFSMKTIVITAALTIAGCGGSGGSSSGTTTTKTTPTITWATPAAIVVGSTLSSTQLDATASVPGTFVYSPSAGTVESTAGTVTLSATFTPTDTTNYNSATASVTLTVNANSKTTPTITWATPTPIVYGTALSSTQLDATTSVAGTFSYSPAAGQVLTAGSQTLTVTFTPTDTTDYNTATASVTLAVAQVTPTITWATPASVVQGATLGATQLDATANVAGSFSYSPAAGSTLSNAGSTTLSATFTPTDTTDYATVTANVALNVTPATSTAVVDFGTTSQTIRGFGVSEAWYGSMTSSEISTLYGTDSGDLGLTIMRLRIAPATWTSSTQTANTSAWTTELGNAKAAQALGATIFATPWTPPASMKTNGSINEGSLSTTSYSDFASYLKAYVNYATSQGVSLYAVSMQNEPDWNPCDPSGTDEGSTGNDCYESCLWTAAEFDTWIASYGSVLTEGKNPVKLMMPESFYFASAMSDTALNDSNAEPYISIVGGHLYGSAPYYYTKAKNKGKDLWMTEHYLSPVSGGSTTSIVDAIAAAKEIHNSMTVGQYNAYVWWWAANSSSTGEETHLLNASYSPTYFGYAIGQFARFVRPGYVRVSAPSTPATGVYLSAYSGSDSSGNIHSVIVAINSNTTAASLPVYIENQTVTSMTPYQTTASGGLTALSAVALSSNNFTATLPAQSITTFVQ
jgi:glucuronoarabinoxylan endo-1,4-beta-xylanase